MVRSLEVPYNFDKDLIDIMFKLDPSGEQYHCIYCPPYPGDYQAAKHYYTHRNGRYMADYYNFSKDEYLSHINYIKKIFPTKMMLLLQQNNYCMDLGMLKEYISYGFSKFCVGNIEQAKQIRSIFPEAEIIASITMKLMPEDLNKAEYDILDGVVLFFPYNRDLETIKKLPSKFRYVLLVNCGCNINCGGTKHWFADEHTSKGRAWFCINNIAEMAHGQVPWDQIIRIRPMDLPIFDPYISYYKLQGREYDTHQIIEEICLYSFNYSRWPSNEFKDSRLYTKEKHKF